MPYWWSWSAVSAIGTLLAVSVALFGEKIRQWLFMSEIEIKEFATVVVKSRASAAEPVIHEHYLEIFHSGPPIENVRFEILEMVSDANKSQNIAQKFYPAGLCLPLKYGQTLTTHDLVKVADVPSASNLPLFPVDMGNNHPWRDRNNESHYRGRFFTQIIGKNYRSDIWIIDFAKDTNVTSNWILEVIGTESEKSFFKRRRNYIREINDSKRRQGHP
jgi:hypothetical protein